jgi:predicted 3-demethylubiquinone-9 3-methyltransferase (glyoxalase superfamily)
MPGWSKMAGMAHTMPYDLAIMAGTQTGKPLPAKRWFTAAKPILVAVGSESEPFFHSGAKALTEMLSHAQYRSLESLNHAAVVMAPKELADAMEQFFLDRKQLTCILQVTHPHSCGADDVPLKSEAKIYMQKINPFLWFDGKAEEAMNFYVSVFKNSKVVSVTRNGEGGPGPKGTVLSATFELEAQRFLALNGGPQFTFSPAISFFVNCETQQEVDELWEKLSEGGEKQRCGWVKDKYGLSWQIIPSALGRMLQDKDPGKARRVMKAMLQMDKIDIQRLKQAYDAE